MVQVLVRALVPSRNKVKVWVLKSIVAYIGWVCCLFWPLHKEVFLCLLLFPFFSKPQIFKTNMHPLCRCTSTLKDVLPLYCHSFILWSKSLDKIRRKKRKWSIWIKIYDPKPRRPLYIKRRDLSMQFLWCTMIRVIINLDIQIVRTMPGAHRWCSSSFQNWKYTVLTEEFHFLKSSVF